MSNTERGPDGGGAGSHRGGPAALCGRQL